MIGVVLTSNGIQSTQQVKADEINAAYEFSYSINDDITERQECIQGMLMQWCLHGSSAQCPCG